MLHARGLDASFFGLHCVMCLSNRQGSPCPFQWKALPQLLADCVGRAAALGRVGVMALFLVQNREPFWGSFSGPFFGPWKKGTYCRSRFSLTFFWGQKLTPKTVFRTGAICRLTLKQNLDSVRDGGNLGQPSFFSLGAASWRAFWRASDGLPGLHVFGSSGERQLCPAFVRASGVVPVGDLALCVGQKQRSTCVSVKWFACAPAYVTLARFHVSWMSQLPVFRFMRLVVLLWLIFEFRRACTRSRALPARCNARCSRTLALTHRTCTCTRARALPSRSRRVEAARCPLVPDELSVLSMRLLEAFVPRVACLTVTGLLSLLSGNGSGASRLIVHRARLVGCAVPHHICQAFPLRM